MVGMDVRIYGKTKKGVKLFAGKIKSVDLKMDKRRSSYLVEMAADTRKTKELKLSSVSRNTCSKENLHSLRLATRKLSLHMVV